MILEAAAILQLFRVFPWSDFQLGKPPKNLGSCGDGPSVPIGGQGSTSLSKNGGRTWKNQRIFQSLSDQHPFKVNPNGQEIHGLRFNLREMFFLVGSHQNPQTQLTQSRQR